MVPITEFEGRDVVVFGLARTGVTAALALMAGGARVHAWDDNETARARAEAQGVTLSDVNARDWRSFSAVVLSPGVPLTHPKPHRVVELARAVGAPIFGDIELFARAVAALPAPARPKIIGITGTNGKSTTTALIGHVLAAAGKDVRVGGNIGEAVLGLPALHAGAIYVLELSSFQLDLTASLRCDVAVLLNLTPDHLDRHGDMAGYLVAKRRIFRNQGAGDWAVVGVDDAWTAGVCTQLTAQGPQAVAPISAGQALGKGVSVIGRRLYDSLSSRTEPAADLAQAPALLGRHNAQNAAAAYAACRALGLEPRVIEQGFRSFPGLPHRLETVGEVSGVRFVNDSKATNAAAAAQALAVYQRVYWIAGGVAKDGGLETLQRNFPRIARAYLIGQAAPAFAEQLAGKVALTRSGDLDTAVTQAYADALASGDNDPVVLLAPACASFDQFKDFEARGDAFRAAVRQLGSEPGALARQAAP